MEAEKPVVMIVDDSEIEAEALGAILAPDYHLALAYSVREALELLDSANPDIVLLDIVMADVDGYGFAETLKKMERYRDTPIIFITALKTGEEDEIRGLALGAVDFIGKPYSPAIVRLRVRNQIQLKLARDQLANQQGELKAHNGELENSVAKAVAELAATTEGLRVSLHEREALLRELHHRTKNNMQLISALLESVSEESQDEAVRRSFDEMAERIFSMSLVHEQLYNSESLSDIEISSYVRDIADHLSGCHNEGASIQFDLEELVVPIDTAIPFGIIINELISNVFAHAFPPGSCGTLQIKLHRFGNDAIEIIVADDGVGLPQGFDVSKDGSLGFALVRELARQLNGSLTFESKEGLHCDLKFPRTDGRIRRI